MDRPPVPPRRHGLVAFDGAIALIAILLIVQMWLLTASLEAFLAGHEETALPAMLASAVLFVIGLGLYLFIGRLDREMRSPTLRPPFRRPAPPLPRPDP